MRWLKGNSGHADLTFVFNPLLGRSDVSSAILADVLAIALAWWRANLRRPDRDFTLNSLLTHWAMLDGPTQEEVVSDALRWLAETRRPPNPAATLVTRLYGVTRGTAWASQVAAVASIYQIDLDRGKGSRESASVVLRLPFRELTAKIDSLARDSTASVSRDFVWQALEGTIERVRQGGAASAGWAIPGLLPLAARTGNSDLLERAKEVASSLVRSGLLTQRQLKGLAHACGRLVDAGAWPDPVDGAGVLTSIGLRRPDVGMPQHALGVSGRDPYRTDRDR